MKVKIPIKQEQLLSMAGVVNFFYRRVKEMPTGNSKAQIIASQCHLIALRSLMVRIAEKKSQFLAKGANAKGYIIIPIQDLRTLVELSEASNLGLYEQTFLKQVGDYSVKQINNLSK